MEWYGFHPSYIYKQHRSATFFDELGFDKIALAGQEGLTGPRLTYIEHSNKAVRDLYLQLSLRVCENPQYFAYSDHLLFVGKIKEKI